MRCGREQRSQTTGEDSDSFTCMRRSNSTTSCPGGWNWGGGSLSTGVDSGTSTVHWISELTRLPKGWVGKPLVLLLGWRVRGQKHVFMEFGNICNADICGISIVMEIFLLISWKMLAIDCVCVFVLCFSHNNHFFYWSRVFHRAWLWSSSGEIVDLRCGTIILFPFSRDWLISFILEREFEIAPKLQPANKRLCDQTWKSRETGRFLHPSLSSLSVRGEFYSFLCY